MDLCTPSQTKILEGGTKDELRIFEGSTFQGREYSIWATNHLKVSRKYGFTLLSIRPESSFGEHKFVAHARTHQSIMWVCFFVNTSLQLCNIVLFSDGCVCIFVKSLQDGFNNTNARDGMTMIWRCVAFSKQCVWIFVQYLQDGFTIIQTHVMWWHDDALRFSDGCVCIFVKSLQDGLQTHAMAWRIIDDALVSLTTICKIKLPTRRFWKDEQMMKSRFSTDHPFVHPSQIFVWGAFAILTLTGLGASHLTKKAFYPALYPCMKRR